MECTATPMTMANNLCCKIILMQTFWMVDDSNYSDNFEKYDDWNKERAQKPNKFQEWMEWKLGKIKNKFRLVKLRRK